MPATEQTWYNQRQLHVVFGITSLLMFIATIWMFAADHVREWKTYQRTFREAEIRLTDWRKRAAQSEDQQAQANELQLQLQLARSDAPDRELVAEFKYAVLQDRLDRGEISQESYNAAMGQVKEWVSGADSGAATFSAINEPYASLAALATRVDQRQQAVIEAEKQVEDANEQLTTAKTLLTQAREATPDAVDAQQAAVDTAAAQLENEQSTLVQARQSLQETADQAVARRSELMNALDYLLDKAMFRENQLLSQRKFRSADLDAAKANLDLAIRDNRTSEFDDLQAKIETIKTESDTGLTALTRKRQAATAHREELQELIRRMSEKQETLIESVEDNAAEITRLENTEIERRSTWFTWSGNVPVGLGKRWLELPILDAFGSPLKIDNLWTENLTLANGSFGRVRRFDRCTTCHKGIDKTAPGSATEPLYEPTQILDFALETPASKPVGQNGAPPDLKEVYGMELAEAGLVNDDDVTISIIQPESAAAKAVGLQDAHGNPVLNGLQVGDVLLFINGDRPLNRMEAWQFMTEAIKWGEPISLTIRRGLPQPYTSHPRLDLYVGSLSPHSLAVMGCTSCHEGQGSATSFKYASHSPNSPEEREEWVDEHDWFNNHHWIYPMYPDRFAESSCLKCHHEVADLEPSDRFPEPPAAKVVEGWKLIGDYGCYGCHEINGYDGPDQRIGPDLRLEPNYSAAAATVKADPHFDQLPVETQELAKQIISHPFDDASRHELQRSLLDDSTIEVPILGERAHEMADVLQDQDAPGTRRKTGPSLRYVAEKLGESFLYDWIREPSNFRPSTKMPQFFGLWDHLEGESLDIAQRYEPVEILGIVRYLLDRSEPFEYLESATGVADPSIERGKLAFEIRGCLACHQHADFPVSTALQGPNLTGLGDKFSEDAGAPAPQQWLYTWIKRPTHYHARTKMPDLYLDPVQQEDGTWVDPVADMVAYLLNDERGWKPPATSVTALQPDTESLDELTMELLASTFPRMRAERYLESGIPESQRDALKGAEVELVGTASQEAKLLYVGRKSIAKYGCYACHDIPGFEGAKPIGAALADWGRKETSKLAFEHILEYLHEGGHGGHAGDAGHDGGHPADAGKPTGGASMHGGEEGPDGESFDDSFYMEQLAAHDRSGFIWQKLTEPRSYDYKKTKNKKYNERLRMPMFPLTPEQREAVVTFVLGLVADPPAEEFVYTPDPRAEAIVDGRRVLEKYNCKGCHILEAEKWVLEFEPGELGSAPEAPEYPFLANAFSPSEVDESLNPDPKRGVLRVTVEGMPVISNDDATQVILDEEGDEVDPDWEYDPETFLYPFEPWRPFLLEGEVYEVGLRRMEVPASTILKQYPTNGGDLTHWLLPRVVEIEKETNPAANGTEAWSWLPPPLLGEGRKVQPEWLHAFLLEPYPIRPAVFMRMPKFNLSPDEATQLVNYFAARDAADYPFTYDDRMLADHLSEEAAEFQAQHETETTRLEHAMQIVTDKNYCIKCHIVGEFMPESNQRALAPDLSKTQYRLQPEYVKRWIANPTRILPYTAMPVNIPYNQSSPTLGGVSQSIYPGTSIEQLDGLTDLLMHYGIFTGHQFDVQALVDAAAAEPAASPEESESASAP